MYADYLDIINEELLKDFSAVEQCVEILEKLMPCYAKPIVTHARCSYFKGRTYWSWSVWSTRNGRSSRWDCRSHREQWDLLLSIDGNWGPMSPQVPGLQLKSISRSFSFSSWAEKKIVVSPKAYSPRISLLISALYQPAALISNIFRSMKAPWVGETPGWRFHMPFGRPMNPI